MLHMNGVKSLPLLDKKFDFGQCDQAGLETL